LETSQTIRSKELLARALRLIASAEAEDKQERFQIAIIYASNSLELELQRRIEGTQPSGPDLGLLESNADRPRFEALALHSAVTLDNPFPYYLFGIYTTMFFVLFNGMRRVVKEELGSSPLNQDCLLVIRIWLPYGNQIRR
jgi:hypothetical protein